MNQTPAAQALKEMVARHGHEALLQDMQRCETLLRDHCPQAKREIVALTEALKHRLPQRLASFSAASLSESTLSGLASHLSRRTGLQDDLSRWAVEAWAGALGLSTPAGRMEPEMPQVSAPVVFRCTQCGTENARNALACRQCGRLLTAEHAVRHGPPRPAESKAGAVRNTESRTCPFCGAAAVNRICGSCGRDTTAPRRPCRACGKMVPSRDRSCWNCGAVFGNELSWKIPVIVLLFAAVFVVSLALSLIR